MGSFHLRPPIFVMPSDTSLPIIDLTYRLVLEVNRGVGEFPRSQRPGLGRLGEAAAFNPLKALGAARYGRDPEKQARLAGAPAITTACRAVGTWPGHGWRPQR